MNDKTKSVVALTDEQVKQCDALLNEFNKLKTLTDTQRVLKRLIENENKTTTEIKSLKSLMRLYEQEKRKVENEKKVVTKRKLAFATAFFNRIDDKMMFDDRLSYKNIIEKMFYDNLLDEKLFADFIANSPEPNKVKLVTQVKEVAPVENETQNSDTNTAPDTTDNDNDSDTATSSDSDSEK